MRASDHCLAYLSRYHKDLAVVTADALPPGFVIPSGSTNVDLALGGGWPRGRVCELSGKPGVGKSTLAAMVTAQVHKVSQSSLALWVDGDYAFSPILAKQHGMDLSRTLVMQPDSMEQAVAAVYDAIHNGVEFVVVDSLCSLRPASEYNHVSQTADQSVVTAQALRLLLAPLARHNATLLIINQIRANHTQMFGKPTTTTGGNALRHYASVQAELTRQTPIKEGDTVLGHTVTFTVTKSKVFAPYRTADVTILYPQSATKDVCGTQWLPTQAGAPVLLRRVR